MFWNWEIERAHKEQAEPQRTQKNLSFHHGVIILGSSPDKLTPRLLESFFILHFISIVVSELRPKTSGEYISSILVPGAWNNPGVKALAK